MKFINRLSLIKIIKHAPLYEQNEFPTSDDFLIERVVSGFMKELE